jgi:pimeloyl-ACP methyl ester carboxylesterase
LRSSRSLSVEGAEIHYETEGGGPPVVLVHGLGLDTRMWDDQVAGLRDIATLVRFDLRGHGTSSAPALDVPYSHSHDLLALLDHLGIASALLVGLSLGGRVVLQAALTAPERVRRLVLLDSVLDGIEWDEKSAQAMIAVRDAGATRGVKAANDLWLAHPLFSAARRNPALAARLASMVGGYSGIAWTGDDPARPLSPRPIDVLEEVAAPTLVVVGDLDVPCFLTMADVLASRIPGARKTVVPDAGHMVNMEAPEAINELLRKDIAATI